MDPVTHLLTGACLARTGLNRTTALATTTLVLSAECPDLDMLANLGGPVTGFAQHRGITHTFLGILLDAVLVLAVLWLFARWRRSRGWQPKQPLRWGVLYGLACLGGLSHLLLDFTNQYGLRPFAPFHWPWYAWDIVAIIEPVMLVLLVGALLLPALFRLINEEIGSRDLSPGRGAAIAALVLIVALWAFRDVQHRRALAALGAPVYRGANAVRVSAYPYGTNPFLWLGVVETEGFFASMHVDSRTGEVDPERRMMVRYKPEETPVTLAAKSSYLGRVYLDWAAYPYVETEALPAPDGGYLVRFMDLRFAYPEREVPPLRARVWLDDKARVVNMGMGSRMQPPD